MQELIKKQNNPEESLSWATLANARPNLQRASLVYPFYLLLKVFQSLLGRQ